MLFISLDNIIYFGIFNFISEGEIVRGKSAKHSNHRKSENFDDPPLTMWHYQSILSEDYFGCRDLNSYSNYQ